MLLDETSTAQAKRLLAGAGELLDEEGVKAVKGLVGNAATLLDEETVKKLKNLLGTLEGVSGFVACLLCLDDEES